MRAHSGQRIAAYAIAVAVIVVGQAVVEAVRDNDGEDDVLPLVESTTLLVEV